MNAFGTLRTEIPFLSARLYFMFGLKLIKTQMMIFFAAKNLLTILVYAYRLGLQQFHSRYLNACSVRELNDWKALIKTSLFVDKM